MSQTIIEKAKRYDEIIEEIKGLLESIRKDKREILEEDITSIFPELKESDDERIRKELIFYLGDMPEDTELRNGVTNRDVLVWLEKQGEQKPQGKTALEAINEEKVDNQFCVKPVDKVEPKFKAGDWIYHEISGNTFHINRIENRTYISDEGATISFGRQKDWRLWIIQDAKDSDILVYNNSIFIFNEICKNCLIYYGIYEDNKFHNDKSYSFLDLDTIDINNIHPATKEQREQLEKAMDDAGYAFDFEKKELKKIDDEIEIPFGSKDSELQEATYYIPKGFHAEIDGDKVVIKKDEKPTAWSEEDELHIRKLESLVKQVWATAEHENDKDTIHKMSNLSFFLKTLKPQLKQEWSEEDETSIAVNNPDAYKIGFADGEAHAKEEQWKPSGAQMIALNDVITNGHLSNANGRILKGLKDQLKKL